MSRGAGYGPNNVLFYATYPDHRIDEIKPGSASPDKEIDLNSTSIGASLGALNFVPPGFASAGHIKIVSYGASTWNDAQVTPDGSGTFDITNIGPAIPLEAAPGPEGLIYVPMGNPDFSTDSVLVTSYGSGNIVAYQIDANGDPIPATAQNFVTGLAGAEGATVDPVTKDFLFSTFGGGNHVVVVRGFDALPFHDDFAGGASPLWGNEVGNWAAAGGAYAAQAPSNNPPTYTGLPFVVDDFTFLVDVQQLQDGGIWLRSADNNNGILLVTGGNGGAGTGFYWQVVTAGSASAQMNPVSGLFVPGVSNAHLRVEVRGSTYAVYVDHAATPATTLTSSAFANGRVGLYDFSAQTFDNVTLSDRFAPVISPFGAAERYDPKLRDFKRQRQSARRYYHGPFRLRAGCQLRLEHPAAIHRRRARPTSLASASLTGLTPHATYHFRAVASNAVDFVNGPDQSFIVPNSPPVAVDDTVASNGEPVSLDPTANDTDADMDTLTVTNFTQGNYGTVTSVGNVLTYTPGSNYFGSDSFGYTVSDSIDASAGTVTVHLDAPLARVVTTSGRGTLGDLVPTGGQPGSSVPAGARWTGFGEPSWASNEVIAYIGKWKGPTGAGIGIFVGNRQIVKVGDSAPDALGNPMSGVAFGGFKDPLVDANGDLVFVATLKGTGVNNTNRIALIGYSGSGLGGPLTLLARTGVSMAAADGATLKTIKSVALSDSGYIIDFTAALTVGTGTPPVTSKTAATLWRIEDSGPPSLLLRPGLSYSFGSLGSQPLKGFGTLMVRGGSPGQGRGLIDNSLPVLAQTATAGTAIGYLGTSSGWSYTRLDDAPGYPAGTKFTSFNLPTQDLNSSLAFRASVKGGPLVGGTTALFAEDESHVLARLVTIGDPARGLPARHHFRRVQRSRQRHRPAGLRFLAVAKGDTQINFDEQPRPVLSRSVRAFIGDCGEGCESAGDAGRQHFQELLLDCLAREFRRPAFHGLSYAGPGWRDPGQRLRPLGHG